MGPVVEDRLQKSLCGPVALAALKHDDNLCCPSGQRELSRRCNHPVLDTATQRPAAERKKIHLSDSDTNMSPHFTQVFVVAETHIGRAYCRDSVSQYVYLAVVA